MNEFEFDPAAGRLTIRNGARTVATTSGTLVCLLPTVHSFNNRTVTYPDFDKDEAYIWTWGVAKNTVLDSGGTPIDRYQRGEYACCMITALPQEYSSKATLMAAPAGANFFVGHVRLSRTDDPNNTWMTRSIDVLPPEDVWIPWHGSGLLEAEVGMARALHVYIDGNSNLVLEAEQSVGPAAKGYGTFGDTPGNTLGSGGGGGEVLFKNKAGLPVFKRDSKAWGYGPNGAQSRTAEFLRRGSLGGTDDNGTARSPCARSDTTNYRSIYSVDIQGRFGRRS